MAGPEATIQKQVFAELRKRGAPGVFFFAVSNNPRGRRTSGHTNGVPDIMCIKHGEIFAIELKAEKGVPSAKQLEAVENIRNAGGFAAICYGRDRAIACLQSWGLILPEAA